MVDHCGNCSHLYFFQKNLFDKKLTIFFLNWKCSSALRAIFRIFPVVLSVAFRRLHFYHLPFYHLAFLLFTNGIFTVWHFYHRHLNHLAFLPTDIITVWHFYHWHFYFLAFLPLAFLLSRIFTNGIFTIRHFYQWHFYLWQSYLRHFYQWHFYLLWSMSNEYFCLWQFLINLFTHHIIRNLFTTVLGY